VPSYVFGQYLPTLLLGTIMDAWITTDPILKCRAAMLGEKDREEWREAHATQDQAPLPSAMIQALRAGTFSTRAAGRLEKALIAAAEKRIEQIRQEWAALRTDDQLVRAGTADADPRCPPDGTIALLSTNVVLSSVPSPIRHPRSATWLRVCGGFYSRCAYLRRLRR
jgi:hypothetical protein